MKIPKNYLLALAAIIWMIAGYNIIHIGLVSYQNYVSPIRIVVSLIIFFIFWFMVFSKLVQKHTARILAYKENLQYFWRFFDLKSFCIMALMITAGLSIRSFHLMPVRYIAVFYSGLGSALFLAGLLFGFHFVSALLISARSSQPGK